MYLSVIAHNLRKEPKISILEEELWFHVKTALTPGQ